MQVPHIWVNPQLQAAYVQQYVISHCPCWLAAWDLCGCMQIRFSTVWLLPLSLLLPFTLL